MKCLVKEIINGKENIYSAIKNDKKIVYQSEANMILNFQDDIVLTRENEEFKINFNFTKNKASILIKENNEFLSLDILTQEIKIDENIFIKYKVLTLNEEIIYKLEVIK